MRSDLAVVTESNPVSLAELRCPLAVEAEGWLLPRTCVEGVSGQVYMVWDCWWLPWGVYVHAAIHEASR